MPPKRPRRRRKSVPCRNRLLCLLLFLLGRSTAIWKPCPSYAKLAKCFKKSEGAINRAFCALEQWEDCPLVFRSGYTGTGNTRQKLFALRSNLLFDEEPLFRRVDGRSRGIRESFRRGVEPVQAEEPEPVLAEEETPAEPVQAWEPDEIQSAPDPFPLPAPESVSESECQTTQKTPDKNPGGYFRFCFKEEKKTTSADKAAPPPPPGLPAPAGLSGFVLEGMTFPDLMRLPADFDVNLLPPPPDWWGRESPNKAAWRHAREALTGDGELFYDNRKPVMPLASLRTLLLPAFERGMSWEREIRPALLWALQQAHDAAVLGEVRNPGGMAAVIFRERLGLPGRIRRRGHFHATTPPPKIKAVPVSAPPPAAPVDRDAVRRQAGALAAMMRAALAVPA